ncbi:MAG: hypothetical protein K0Q47_34 [Sedimentibacter sp.]|jgi:hypothetical protein|nr:hypothetical protein [Sedimentibacter sp.]
MNGRYAIEEVKSGKMLTVLGVNVGPGITKIQGKEYNVVEEVVGYPLGSYVVKFWIDGETPEILYEILNHSKLDSKEKWAEDLYVMELKRLR